MSSTEKDSATNPKLEASISMLAMSIASSAAMFLGLTPNPSNNQIQKDKSMARFNIDLLIVLQEKTKGNLSDEEKNLLDTILNDLQMKFLTTQF